LKPKQALSQTGKSRSPTSMSIWTNDKSNSTDNITVAVFQLPEKDGMDLNDSRQQTHFIMTETEVRRHSGRIRLVLDLKNSGALMDDLDQQIWCAKTSDYPKHFEGVNKIVYFQELVVQGAARKDPSAISICSLLPSKVTLALEDWCDWIRDPSFEWGHWKGRKERAMTMGKF
jgi:hypothetical protein